VLLITKTKHLSIRMFSALLQIIRELYSDIEIDLGQKAIDIWKHGQFIDLIKTTNGYMVIYKLDKTFHHKFAILYLTERHHRVVKIEFLEELEASSIRKEEVLNRLSWK
jgi:hypothetical protein